MEGALPLEILLTVAKHCTDRSLVALTHTCFALRAAISPYLTVDRLIPDHREAGTLRGWRAKIAFVHADPEIQRSMLYRWGCTGCVCNVHRQYNKLYHEFKKDVPDRPDPPNFVADCFDWTRALTKRQKILK